MLGATLRRTASISPAWKLDLISRARSSFGHHARSRSECRLRSPLTGGARHQQPPLCPMRKMTTSAADIGLCSRSGETPELFISNNQDVAPHRFGGTHQGRQPRIVAPALGPSHLRLEVTGLRGRFCRCQVHVQSGPPKTVPASSTGSYGRAGDGRSPHRRRNDAESRRSPHPIKDDLSCATSRTSYQTSGSASARASHEF